MKIARHLVAVSTIAIALATGPAVTNAVAQDIDVIEITIADIMAAYEAGTYTTEQLVQTYLDRIATYEDAYNAFTHMNPDALADARAIDAARAAGEPLGPLAGIPIVIKEAMDVAGMPSTVGWAPLASDVGGIDLIPETDAPVVARLRAAGAIILGKTNIPAFSGSASNANTSWDGPTYNAYGFSFTPGGSSTGSAVSVTGNLAVLATAEETSGSITAPAGYQGIYGLKPTFGLTPNVGVAPIAGSMRDVVGPFARTVTDAALMLDVMAGYTPEDPKTLLSLGHIPEGGYSSLFGEVTFEGTRIGLFGPGWRSNRELADETSELYDAAIAEIVALGATAVPDPFEGSGFNELDTSAGGINLSFGYDFNAFLQRLGPSAAANSNAELAPFLPAEEVAEGRGAIIVEPNSAAVPDMTPFVDARLALLDTLHTVLDESDVDVLVYPHAAIEGGDLIASPIINIAGIPALIVPAGYYESGMPFSLVLIGPEWSEAELLAYAYEYEQTYHHRIPPVMVTERPVEETAE